jgi:homoserine dehydrogenase
VTSVWRETPDGVAPGGGTAAPAAPVRARLRAEELDIEHPLAALSGESLGAVLHTDLMADVVVSERHGLVPQTAYGVYADLLHLCRTS